MIPFAPPRLLEVTLEDGALTPRWLSDRDAGWLAELGVVLEEIDGRAAASADDVARGRVHAIAKRWDVPHRVVAFAAWVERRRFGLRVDAAVEPERVRDLVFEIAATTRRDDA